MAEYADPFPGKVWKRVRFLEEEDMADRRKYNSVSLEPEALAQLHLAKAWMTGERGQVVSLSDTVAQLVDWYAEARAAQSVAEKTDKPEYAKHTKENPHKVDGCDVCGYNAYLDSRSN